MMKKDENVKVGDKFTTLKGGIVEIKEKLSNTLFIGECSICSEDKELWYYGSILLHKDYLLKNKVSCGCCGFPRYTTEQWKVRLKRKLQDYLKDFIVSYEELDSITSATKIQYKCKKHNNSLSKLASKIITEGISCPDCKSENLEADIEKLKTKLPNNILNKYKEIKPIPKHKHSTKEIFVDVYCEDCAQDEYSKNEVGSGWFRVNISSLKAGSIPCRCSSSHSFSREQREYQINKILSKEGGHFIEWCHTSNEQIKVDSKFTYMCKNGHTVTKSVDSFVNVGTRCVKCKKVGYFNRDQPAKLYLARFYNDSSEFLKVGITNNDHIYRLNKQKSKARHKFEYEIIKVFDFDKGIDAWNLERKIKTMFDRNFMDRKIFRHGFTETFNIGYLDQILDVTKEFIEYLS